MEMIIIWINPMTSSHTECDLYKFKRKKTVRILWAKNIYCAGVSQHDAMRLIEVN